MSELGKIKVFNELENSCGNKHITMRGFLLFVGVPEDALHLAAPSLNKNDKTFTAPRTPVHVSSDFKAQVKNRILSGPGSRGNSRGHGSRTGPLDIQPRRHSKGQATPPGTSVEDVARILNRQYNDGGKGVSAAALFRFLTVDMKMRISRQDVTDLHSMLDLGGNGYVQVQEVVNFLNLGAEYDRDESLQATIRATQEAGAAREGVVVDFVDDPAAGPEQGTKWATTQRDVSVEEASKLFRARIEANFAGVGGSKDMVSVFKSLKRQKGQGLMFGEFWKACKDMELDVPEKSIHNLFDHIAEFGNERNQSTSRKAPINRTTVISMIEFGKWWFGGQVPAFSEGSFLDHLSNSAELDRGAMKHKGIMSFGGFMGDTPIPLDGEELERAYDSLQEDGELWYHADSQAAPAHKVKLQNLTVRQVGDFLRREHLAPWVSAFSKHNVDGKILSRPDFCEQDLLEIGVDVRLSRLRFLEAVKKAKKNGIDLPPMELSHKNIEPSVIPQPQPHISPIKPSTHLHGTSSLVNDEPLPFGHVSHHHIGGVQNQASLEDMVIDAAAPVIENERQMASHSHERAAIQAQQQAEMLARRGEGAGGAELLRLGTGRASSSRVSRTPTPNRLGSPRLPSAQGALPTNVEAHGDRGMSRLPMQPAVGSTAPLGSVRVPMENLPDELRRLQSPRIATRMGSSRKASPRSPGSSRGLSRSSRSPRSPRVSSGGSRLSSPRSVGGPLLSKAAICGKVMDMCTAIDSTERSGLVTVSELWYALERAGVSLSDSEMVALLQRLPLSEDGRVDFIQLPDVLEEMPLFQEWADRSVRRPEAPAPTIAVPTNDRDPATSIAVKMFLKWAHVKKQVMLSDQQGEKFDRRTGFIGLQMLVRIMAEQNINLDSREAAWIGAKYSAGDGDIEYTTFLNEMFTKGSERRRTPVTPTGEKKAETLRNMSRMGTVFYSMMHQFSHTWKSFRQKCKEVTSGSTVPARSFRSLLEAHGILLTESQLFAIIAVYSITPTTNRGGAPSELLIDFERFIADFLKEMYAHQHGSYGAENTWRDGDFDGRPDPSTMQARFKL